MSSEAEREIEDLFNAEVFGVDTTENEVTPIVEVPEAKPVEETVVAEEEAEGTPLIELDLEDDGQTVTLEETPAEEEYIAWAKKQYGEEMDPAKLAKAAFEKERLLGEKAEESKLLKQERDAQEMQARVDALNTPGNLSPEEDVWVDEAISSSDPGVWAYNALEGERPDLYAAVMDRWASLGESESRAARIMHSQIVQAVTSSVNVDPQEQVNRMMDEAFATVGLNRITHGPVILAKASELGGSHPSVIGLNSQNMEVRALAARQIYDLAAMGKTTVQKAIADDVVEGRVKEQQLRDKAAGVTTGKPHVAQPKKSEWWTQFDEELKERGWDGNGPVYGRD